MMASGDPDETRAFARLPGLDIAVLHRTARGEHGEQVVIAMRAAPSFGAIGGPIGPANPLLLWMQLAEVAWSSWLGWLAAARAPPGGAPTLGATHAGVARRALEPAECVALGGAPR